MQLVLVRFRAGVLFDCTVGGTHLNRGESRGPNYPRPAWMLYSVCGLWGEAACLLASSTGVSLFDGESSAGSSARLRLSRSSLKFPLGHRRASRLSALLRKKVEEAGKPPAAKTFILYCRP